MRTVLLIGAYCAAVGVATPALALEGGGFRAQSVGAGFITGMLAAIGRQRGTEPPTFEATALLDRFKTISTSSGSSWFFSSLAYSNQFKTLLEKMSAQPERAAGLYKAGYTNPWLLATHVNERKFNLAGAAARAIAKLLFGTGDEDSIYLITYFLVTGFTWNDFVDVLLNSTAALTSNTPLGAPTSGAFADGKAWVACHTVVTPGSGGRVARLYQGKLGYPRVSYTVQASGGGGGAFPDYVPAVFSVTLGAGVGSAAPYRYVASSAVEGLRTIDYLGLALPLFGRHSASTSALAPVVSNSSYCRDAGRLPVSKVAAASSAFIGAATMMGAAVGELQALISGDVTPWIASASRGRPFDEAASLVGALRGGVTQRAVEALAAAGVHGVIDGGYTDNSGVASAVAVGSDEVVALVNANASSALTRLFAGGGCSGCQPFEPTSLFPVFARPSASAANAAFRGFTRLQLPASTTYLTELAVGSLKTVTASNGAWGIAAGRTVTLHVVSLSSSLNIGLFENLAHYDQLAQEIALTISSDANAPLVRSTLIPMMLGPRRARRPDRRQ